MSRGDGFAAGAGELLPGRVAMRRENACHWLYAAGIGCKPAEDVFKTKKSTNQLGRGCKKALQNVRDRGG